MRANVGVMRGRRGRPLHSIKKNTKDWHRLEGNNIIVFADSKKRAVRHINLLDIRNKYLGCVTRRDKLGKGVYKFEAVSGD